MFPFKSDYGAKIVHLLLYFSLVHTFVRGNEVAQLIEALRYKPSSIPDGVIGIFC
jgi:hypothetical protein